MRTWYGVYRQKFELGDYNYICFNIKGKRKFYFEKEQFIGLIENIITKPEQVKYDKRKSYDNYIYQNHQGDWYIKRLGSHLLTHIKIV